jgi:hypothetical protein
MNSEPRHLTASGAGLFGKGLFPQNAARGLLGAAAHKQDSIFQIRQRRLQYQSFGQ